MSKTSTPKTLGAFDATTGLLWIVQIQCVLQVVANRLSFLVFRRSKRARLAVLHLMTFITVTGACTWLPGSLQLTTSIIHVASIWDRCNKSLFSAIDLTLNIIFLRMVWRKLVSVGLTKYKQLFYFNACMSFISVSSDVSHASQYNTSRPSLIGKPRSYLSSSSRRQT